ncbi:MAG TPA: hypothetical protein VFG69_06775 [Nannocystaceae bacterium]|nr:hypothetical protein [Nannocystaceae bacterium]
MRVLLLAAVLAACAGRGAPPVSVAPVATTPRPQVPVVAPPREREPPPPPQERPTEPAAIEPAIVAEPAPIHGVLPLSADARAVFLGSPEDPVPTTRGGIVRALEDVSYIVGNEWSLDAFHASIAGLGGGYVGVGPDQAYLLVGWQRPELAWLIDYDPKVLRVHAMYRALVLAAETPAEFLAFFEPEGVERAQAAIAGHDDRDRHLRRLYRNNRDMFRWRLVTVARKLEKRGVPCWLTDDETYAFVRQMLVEGRVRPLRVNLLEDQGMQGIAAAARDLGVPIRVLYLSNAETYWDEYAAQYRENVAALPTDDLSLLLRTVLVWGVNKDYVYFAQSIESYVEWLAAPGVRSVVDIVGKKPKAERGIVNFVLVDGPPPS